MELELTYANDDELFAKSREGLFTAVVGDVMDMMGHTTSSCRR